jgi:hypothetical protein
MLLSFANITIGVNVDDVMVYFALDDLLSVVNK